MLLGILDGYFLLSFPVSGKPMDWAPMMCPTPCRVQGLCPQEPFHWGKEQPYNKLVIATLGAIKSDIKSHTGDIKRWHKKPHSQLFLVERWMGREGFSGEKDTVHEEGEGTSAEAWRCVITPDVHKRSRTVIPSLRWGVTWGKNTDMGKVRSGSPSKEGTEGKPISQNYYIFRKHHHKLDIRKITSFKK